jgi:hypothetical protein
VFERLVLQTICGPKLENGVYSKRYNFELERVLGEKFADFLEIDLGIFSNKKKQTYILFVHVVAKTRVSNQGINTSIEIVQYR